MPHLVVLQMCTAIGRSARSRDAPLVHHAQLGTAKATVHVNTGQHALIMLPSGMVSAPPLAQDCPGQMPYQ